MIKYANDITLLHFVRSAADDLLQRELDNVLSWSEKAGLQLNLSKCSITNFVTSKALVCPPVFCNGEAVSHKANVKNLGVTFSDDLRWNTHFCNQIKKACKRIFIFRNLKRAGCNENILMNVYIAVVRSILLYSYPCFCNAPMYLHDKLIKLEKRIFRIASQHNIACDNILSAAEKHCASLYTRVQSTAGHPLLELFEKRFPTHRNPSILRRPRANTKRFSQSFIKYCPT